MNDLKFGTSGLRGLVRDLTGGPAADWCLAFLRSGAAEPRLGSARQLLVGRDLRASSPDLARDCLAAATFAGFEAVDCGAVPTPALALAALSRGVPAVMVTGSHIPDDRNGLKFYRADGEITKNDEARIRDHHEPNSAAGADAGDFATADVLAPYEARYLEAFGADALSGLTVGVYQHSTVARDILCRVLGALGASTIALGRSDAFVPVDTEAHRPEDVELIAGWCADGTLDAVVSADGDADRPLIADARGRILRGDVVGLLTARQLGATVIATPVTSSSAIERTGIASQVHRTRVGSPYVIEAILNRDGLLNGPVVGFEANGGVLLGSAAKATRGTLAPLPTRDGLLPIVCVLAQCVELQRPLADLVRALGAGHAAAHRLENVDPEAMRLFLARLADDAAFRDRFFRDIGPAEDPQLIDGVRVSLEGGGVVHYRASGNAPELRCYAEGADETEARALLEWGLGAAERALRGSAA